MSEQASDRLFEEGKPDRPQEWREKLVDREEMLRFLRTAERYWYGDGFGSERRKTPA